MLRVGLTANVLDIEFESCFELKRHVGTTDLLQFRILYEVTEKGDSHQKGEYMASQPDAKSKSPG